MPLYHIISTFTPGYPRPEDITWYFNGTLINAVSGITVIKITVRTLYDCPVDSGHWTLDTILLTRDLVEICVLKTYIHAFFTLNE